MKKEKFIVILSLVSFLLHPQSFQTGTTTITFNDPSRTGGFGSGGGPGRQIQTEIYYPAVSAGSNVPLASGQFPVIVFGHGFVMTWDSYDNIYKELSQRGYIVALPRTEGGFSPNHDEFGKDLKWVASRMLALNTTNTLTGLFVGKLNQKVGIGGHSMGGGCSFLASSSNNTIHCLFNFAAAETNPKASIAAKNVSVPTLLLGGGGDCVTPPATNQDVMYDSCGTSRKFEIILKNLTHCDFSNGNNFNCNFGQNSSGCPSTLTIVNAQKRYMNFLNPFLDHLLKNDCQAGNTFMDSLNMSNTIQYKKAQGILSCSVSSFTDFSKNSESILIFPNPAISGWLTLSAGKNISEVIITSIDGSTVLSRSFSGNTDKIRIPVMTLPCGIYIVVVKDNDGNSFYKKWVYAKE